MATRRFWACDWVKRVYGLPDERINRYEVLRIAGYSDYDHRQSKQLTQTIRSVFPESATQICVVHQIRNSCRYVVWKDKKEFSRDMKDIYAAPTKQAALLPWKV